MPEEFIMQCLNEVQSMTIAEKRAFMLEKIRGTIVSIAEDSGYAKHRWKVGQTPNRVIQPVCRHCFQLCYNVGNTFVDDIVKCIKNKEHVTGEKPLSDTTRTYSDVTGIDFIQRIAKFAANRGLVSVILNCRLYLF